MNRISISLVAVLGAFLFIAPLKSEAYERYNDGCNTCHGEFTGPTSPRNTVFPDDSKHEMHRNNAAMNTDCDLCHTNGDNRNPYTGSSNGTNNNTGYGCVGCHGRLEDAGNDTGKPGLGAGLRQHHYNSGTMLCAACHTDADPARYTPVGENVKPPYYGTADTLAAGSCNPVQATNTNENWSVGDFVGLDNDGDLLYDSAADADCLSYPLGLEDLTTFADVTGDSVPDLAGFGSSGDGRPSIVLYSGATGALSATTDFLNANWLGIALGAVSDGNQDGTADDPAASMLAVNTTSKKIRVETRTIPGGALISSIQFLNENWKAVDAVIVDDLNGDAISNDSAIAVLSERFSDGRIQLQLRDLSTGTLISNVVYLNARWTPIAAAVASRLDLPPLIGVIAEKRDDGRRVLQSRVAGAGTFDRNIKVLGSAWDYQDVSVIHDANGDGATNDPVWAVMATRPSDNVIRVQTRFVSDGSFDDNVAILNANWESLRLDAGLDMGGGPGQELVITAIRRADGQRRIHVKDYNSGATTINIAP